MPRPFPSVGSLLLENLGVGRWRRPAIPTGAVQVDQPAAAALLVRRAAFDQAGGFDERFFPAWYEDVEFARRLADLGWERWFEPRARFDHEGGYSARMMGIERFLEAYHSNQFRYARGRLSPRAVPWIKGALVAGTLGRMVARPRLAAGYWRGLRRVLSR
jgi:GT2 family glycosyltransferase